MELEVFRQLHLRVVLIFSPQCVGLHIHVHVVVTSISYNISARGAAGLQVRDPRARVPINRNIPSVRCHN